MRRLSREAIRDLNTTILRAAAAGEDWQAAALQLATSYSPREKELIYNYLRYSYGVKLFKKKGCYYIDKDGVVCKICYNIHLL